MSSRNRERKNVNRQQRGRGRRGASRTTMHRTWAVAATAAFVLPVGVFAITKAAQDPPARRGCRRRRLVTHRQQLHGAADRPDQHSGRRTGRAAGGTKQPTTQQPQSMTRTRYVQVPVPVPSAQSAQPTPGVQVVPGQGAAARGATTTTTVPPSKPCVRSTQSLPSGGTVPVVVGPAPTTLVPRPRGRNRRGRKAALDGDSRVHHGRVLDRQDRRHVDPARRVDDARPRQRHRRVAAGPARYEDRRHSPARGSRVDGIRHFRAAADHRPERSIVVPGEGVADRRDDRTPRCGRTPDGDRRRRSSGPRLGQARGERSDRQPLPDHDVRRNDRGRHADDLHHAGPCDDQWSHRGQDVPLQRGAQRQRPRPRIRFLESDRVDRRHRNHVRRRADSSRAVNHRTGRNLRGRGSTRARK